MSISRGLGIRIRVGTLLTAFFEIRSFKPYFSKKPTQSHNYLCLYITEMFSYNRLDFDAWMKIFCCGVSIYRVFLVTLIIALVAGTGAKVSPIVLLSDSE